MAVRPEVDAEDSSSAPRWSERPRGCRDLRPHRAAGGCACTRSSGLTPDGPHPHPHPHPHPTPASRDPAPGSGSGSGPVPVLSRFRSPTATARSAWCGIPDKPEKQAPVSPEGTRKFDRNSGLAMTSMHTAKATRSSSRRARPSTPGPDRNRRLGPLDRRREQGHQDASGNGKGKIATLHYFAFAGQLRQVAGDGIVRFVRIERHRRPPSALQRLSPPET